MKTLRLAILNTSTDNAPWALAYPDDGQRFASLLSPIRSGWAYEVFAVKDDVFPKDISVFDGIIITGSPASVHDDLPWIHRLKDLIRTTVERRQPLFGCCFGHQLIATALGGQVGWNPDGCSLGITETVFHEARPWMMPRQTSMRLPSGNFEQVTCLPVGAESLGSSDANPCASFSIGSHVFTSQYHPEMPLDFVSDMIADLAETVGAEKADAAHAALTLPTDSAVFAEWMVRFFEQPR
jgi:GMP synthase-like glutamine amidotransferase